MIHDALFGEERLVQFLQNLGSRAQLPLRVALWNGGSVALGPAPRVTIRVPRREAARYLLPPSLDNLAEGYIRGELDVDGPIETVIEAAYGLARNSVQPVGRFGRVMQALTHTRRRDAQAIAHHYDVSNDFYQLWLGPQMVYSCAYFASGAETLEQAQTAKLDHILTKIMLQPNERLLDIGCGWGGLALRAASHFGARVQPGLGLDLSSAGVQGGCRCAPQPHAVEPRVHVSVTRSGLRAGAVRCGAAYPSAACRTVAVRAAAPLRYIAPHGSPDPQHRQLHRAHDQRREAFGAAP